MQTSSVLIESPSKKKEAEPSKTEKTVYSASPVSPAAKADPSSTQIKTEEKSCSTKCKKGDAKNPKAKAKCGCIVS